MVARRIGVRQHQFDRALGLGQSRQRAGARGVHDKDQHAVGLFLVPPDANVRRHQQQPITRGHHLRADFLPWGGLAQGGDHINLGTRPRFSRARRHGPPAPFAGAHRARAGIGGPHRAGHAGRLQAGEQVRGQCRARGFDQQIVRNIRFRLVLIGALFRLVLGRGRCVVLVGRWGVAGQGCCTVGQDQRHRRFQIAIAQRVPAPQRGMRARASQRQQRRTSAVDLQLCANPHQPRAVVRCRAQSGQTGTRRGNQRHRQDYVGRVGIGQIIQRQEQAQTVGQGAGKPFAFFRRFVQCDQGQRWVAVQPLPQPHRQPSGAAFGHRQHQHPTLRQQPRMALHLARGQSR